MAIKKLARPFQSAVHAKRTYRELRLLKHMNHENVIGLLDVFHPGGLTIDSFDQVYLVTHLMGADLNNIIRTQRLSDDHVQFLVYQVLRGLKYIHSAGIIHRVSQQCIKMQCMTIHIILYNILYIYDTYKYIYGVARTFYDGKQAYRTTALFILFTMHNDFAPNVCLQIFII